jgi:hypothetical protein
MFQTSVASVQAPSAVRILQYVLDGTWRSLPDRHAASMLAHMQSASVYTLVTCVQLDGADAARLL